MACGVHVLDYKRGDFIYRAGGGLSTVLEHPSRTPCSPPSSAHTWLVGVHLGKRSESSSVEGSAIFLRLRPILSPHHKGKAYRVPCLSFTRRVKAVPFHTPPIVTAPQPHVRSLSQRIKAMPTAHRSRRTDANHIPSPAPAAPLTPSFLYAAATSLRTCIRLQPSRW